MEKHPHGHRAGTQVLFRTRWKLGSSRRGPGKNPGGIGKFLGSALSLLDAYHLVIFRSGSEQTCGSGCVGQGRSEHHPGGGHC